MTEFINLTPHVINIIAPSGRRDIPPSGTVARVAENATEMGELGGIPLISKAFGEVTNLPALQPGRMFIVSGLVAAAAWKAGRTDVACPGNPVRDETGRIIGCEALCVAPEFISAEWRDDCPRGWLDDCPIHPLGECR